jgi:hypothetical protein
MLAYVLRPKFVEGMRDKRTLAASEFSSSEDDNDDKEIVVLNRSLAPGELLPSKKDKEDKDQYADLELARLTHTQHHTIPFAFPRKHPRCEVKWPECI